jgi:pentatricopeptide repeat protein
MLSHASLTFDCLLDSLNTACKLPQLKAGLGSSDDVQIVFLFAVCSLLALLFSSMQQPNIDGKVNYSLMMETGTLVCYAILSASFFYLLRQLHQFKEDTVQAKKVDSCNFKQSIGTLASTDVHGEDGGICKEKGTSKEKRNSEVQLIEKGMERMVETGVEPNNVFSYSAMIVGCAKAGDLVRAEHWHRRMLEKGLKPNAETYSALISAFAKTGDVVTASLYLMSMEKAQIQTDVTLYCSILDACAKAGDAERAEQIFRRMQSADIQPNVAAYASLAQSVANRGDWNGMEQLIEKMSNQGHSMNQYVLSALLISYAAAHPPQAQRAEVAFLEGRAKGIKLTWHGIDALRRAVGVTRYKQLTSEDDTQRKQLSPQPPAMNMWHGSTVQTSEQVRRRPSDHGRKDDCRSYTRPGKYPCYVKAGKSKSF